MSNVTVEYCTREILTEFNFNNVQCISLLISKVLSIGILLGALVYKLPQVLVIQRKRDGTGISVLSLAIELLSCVLSITYAWNNNKPFTTFGESLFVVFFDIFIIAQVLTYNYRAPLGIWGLTSIGVVLAAVAFNFLLSPGFVPASSLPTLQMLVAPCVILSRAPQIYSNYKARSTGQLSLITWVANFGGGLARIFTTLREVQDPLVLGTFILATTLNGIIVAQILMYWGNGNSAAKSTNANNKKNKQKKK
eukprot:TRINITY_DN21814_c0_g1_i1.p1 TRINITY_DN21814_c0_g1~~TRINITY_DN21814_c0_g1_i1.p1  ORF type:complete len:251 (-),score=55.99 TRINITY_DN21814_c0_g1_i1:35-787(-)